MPAFKFSAPCKTGAALLLALISAQADASPGATLYGRVAAGASLPIVVVALDRDAGRVVHRVFLEHPGDFRMPLAPGRYRFYAYADEDRDGERSAGAAVSEMFVLSGALRAGDRVVIPVLRLR